MALIEISKSNIDKTQCLDTASVVDKKRFPEDFCKVLFFMQKLFKVEIPDHGFKNKIKLKGWELMKETRFHEFELHEDVLRAIDDMGFEEPSKIQDQVIPVLLQGSDAIGQAQTGTGKTLAFGAPIVSALSRSGDKPRCIVVAPTRELAIQVNDELNRIAKYKRLRILPVFGGQSYDRQIMAIRRGLDIVVGTPGRLIDLMNRKVLDLSEVNKLVLDEADEMLNMGFIDDIETIIQQCREDRQTMLFSATMPPTIRNLARKYMKSDAQHVSITGNALTVSKIDQYYYEIKHKDRLDSLCRILDVDEPAAAIIFCRTKKGVDELVEGMQIRGYNVEGMHGDLSQNQRLNTLRKFRDGSIEFLVATDVAARGIDVERVTHVINYDLPQDAESYVHRIGRTGRANREGIAYTLVSAREYMALKQIEKITKSKIRRKEIPSVDEIFLSKYKSIVARIDETLQGEEYKKFVTLAQEMDEEYSLVDVAASLMCILFKKEMSFDYEEDSTSDSRSEYKRLFINVGRVDQLRPMKLIDFVCANAKTNKRDFGNIDIQDKITLMDVNPKIVKSIIKGCAGKKLCGRKVFIDEA